MTEHHCLRCEDVVIPITENYCAECIDEIACDYEPDPSPVSADENWSRVVEAAYGPGGYKR